MRRFSLTRSGESIMFNRAVLCKALGRLFPNLTGRETFINDVHNSGGISDPQLYTEIG